MPNDKPINFTTKLNVKRPYDSRSVESYQPEDIEYALESDRGRIINSASVRRLQQKTQVFPLERNAAVRSRLTHSLEVQQNGRYLVKTIFKKFGAEQVEALGLKGLQPSVESLVEMACLMHDIGNPPFGHFGEVAISEWFQKHLPTFQVFKTASDQELAAKMLHDLRQFEGNAQAIRLTFSLQQMNLTYAQTATILKYTRAAYEAKDDSGNLSYLQKKPGFYMSEQGFVKDMLNQLSIQAGHRHPFTYVMEAADDMAYCLADLEDAVEKDILSIKELSRLLKDTFVAVGGQLNDAKILNQSGGYSSFDEIIDLALHASTHDVINHNHAYFVKLRINLIHHLVNHAAQRFIDNLEAVYSGSFNEALLEDGSVANKIVKTFKQVGYKYVFNHQEVQDLELQGYQIIAGLLNVYLPILHMPLDQFLPLIKGEQQGMNYHTLLLNRMDTKIRKSYLHDVANVVNNQNLWEFYFRCRLLQDHISAMTDHSAWDEYKLLNVTG